jgi:hypothetical protein
MDWVSGVVRDENGQLGLQVQDAEGVRAFRSLSDGEPRLNMKGTVRRKVRFQFEAAARVDAAAYLRGVGLEHLDGRGQVVYAVPTSAGVAIIPSQLLVLATVGAQAHCREVLLEPSTPGDLMQVFAVAPGYRLQTESPSRIYNQEPLVERLTWLLTYPSAHAAWGSVYRNAVEGRFDMRLPKAEVLASAHGLLEGSTLYVTELNMLELTPMEDPFPFAAAGAQSTFVLNNKVSIRNTHGQAAAPAAEARIGAAGVVAPLTDAQWAGVEQLAKTAEPKRPGRPRAHSLRDIVECIRVKLGTPYSWSKCPGDKALVQSASVLLSKLQREGTWEQVLAVMAAAEES